MILQRNNMKMLSQAYIGHCQTSVRKLSYENSRLERF